MKVILDVNIWIDIAARPKTFPESGLLYQALRTSGNLSCLPLSGYTTVYYLLEKTIGREGAEEFLLSLLNNGTLFVPFTFHELKLAHRLRIRDHEDACLVACAINAGCELLVTRNIRDFKWSPIKACLPDKAFNILELR